MRAVRGTADGTGVEVVEVPAPTEVHDRVRVRVAATGICGSDLHLLAAGALAGRVPGHEIAGYAPDGRAVAVDPSGACRSCEYCLQGDESLCATAVPGLIGIGVDGGMADYVSVPTQSLVELPRGLDVAAASLVEPTAVAVRGLRMTELTPGRHVAVVGAGAIGLCAVAVARSMGATVELHARHDHQRLAGDRLGAGAPTDTPCTLVVDAAGTTSSLAAAAQRCGPGGTILALATYWDQTDLPGMDLSVKEIRLRSSMMYGHTQGSRDMDIAAEVVASTPELPRAVITHRYPLDGGSEAFAQAADRGAGTIKVMLEP